MRRFLPLLLTASVSAQEGISPEALNAIRMAEELAANGAKAEPEAPAAQEEAAKAEEPAKVEEAETQDGEKQDKVEPETPEEEDENSVLSKLTIAMATDVVDSRTFTIRHEGEVFDVRIGNLEAVNKYTESTLTEEECEAKRVKKLEALVAKQMLLWDKAPEEQQNVPSRMVGGDAEAKLPAKERKTVVADVWTVDGKHIAYHLAQSNKYLYEQNIVYQGANVPEGFHVLMAAADQKKKESYEELNKAMKASASEMGGKKKKSKVAEEYNINVDEELVDEDFGWMQIGILCMLVLLVVGWRLNFGRKKMKWKGNKPSKEFVEKTMGKAKAM